MQTRLEQSSEPHPPLRVPVQASAELRNQALQRRDAALLALSFLSRCQALGPLLASTPTLVPRLALIVETTVGITDAPSLAAATLARIASAPGAASATAAALEAGGGLLQRLLSAGTFNTAVQADITRLAQALQPAGGSGSGTQRP